MVALLPALALAATYSFPPGRTFVYDMEVGFDGFLPILGSETGSASVTMALEVGGLPPDEAGRARAYSDLKEAKLVFNGVALPFSVENIRGYFPKTTITFDPLGKVLETDAPNVQLPIKLPGLDVKRFPEISYLPLELPADGLAEGKRWTFVRRFDAGPMEYQVSVARLTDSRAELTVTVSQRYDTLENEAREVVEEEKDAVARVSTVLAGNGTVVFDFERGIAVSVDVTARATSEVADLKTGTKSKRQLDTTLKVRLREPKAPLSGLLPQSL